MDKEFLVKLLIGALLLIAVVLGVTDCTLNGVAYSEPAVVIEKLYKPASENMQGTPVPESYRMTVELEDSGQRHVLEVDALTWMKHAKGERVTYWWRQSRLTGITYLQAIRDY